MPNDRNKASLLSSKLDFEQVTDVKANLDELDFSHLTFDEKITQESLDAWARITPSDVVPVELADAASPASPPPAASVAASRPYIKADKRKTSSKKKGKNDNFAFYAAIIALLSFFINIREPVLFQSPW